MREHEITGGYIVILTSFKLLSWSGNEESLGLAKKKFISDNIIKIKENLEVYKG